MRRCPSPCLSACVRACVDRGVMIQGNKLTVEEQQVTEESATYRAEWVTTGLSKTKKGERQTMHVQLQVSNEQTHARSDSAAASVVAVHPTSLQPIDSSDGF